ncbi:MAG: glycosyltransferase [Litorimonas sp.]
MSSNKNRNDQYFRERGVAPRKDAGFRANVSIVISKIVLTLHNISPFLAKAFTRVFYLGRRDRAYMRLYWVFQHRDERLARRYRNEALQNGAEDAEVIKSAALEAYRSGSLRSSAFEAERLLITPRFVKLIGNVRSSLELLQDGFHFIPKATSSMEPKPNRGLYFLHNSLPINSGGYATRSHGILTHVNQQGFEISGVTRLGFPHDRGKAYADKSYDVKDNVDGVDYFRLLSKDIGLGKLPIKEYLQANIAAHMPLIEAERPQILHGASNFINGLTANALAKSFGLISIYETRGLWEITRMSREPEYEGTDAFNLYVRMETQASLEADHCFAITQALKSEMVQRGVPAQKITVIPNGVDTKRFQPLTRDLELKSELGFGSDDLIIGYIGSVVDYEGLDYLIKSMKQLVSRGYKNAKLLIVGDGAVLDDLKELTRKLRLTRYVHFTGRVPHEDVERYYSIIEVTPFPRKGYPVCEMVSPLKPFEAMAMEKTIVISDVAAMKEFVEHGVTGLIIQKDNVDALTDGLISLIDNADLRKSLGAAALDYVRKERDWDIIAARVSKVYAELIKRHTDKPKSQL